ncbi:hypothetical protein Rumeso_02452 [Rubellimicrobium mesophilum DSM 19309]|uniref:DUF4440 domain-containing protein n=1 Tax=Rubellimicrobium mesophilum DSM 19309 TaxID=442562 RepID=A0A017HPF4_9RHOB|nr:hypothetical protein [Rubellimicrobium mesophilum]EYD76023.1 hypothetical protein Rumeso_02452 [Rubellimicrobium mesophilum DSM 19309]
MTELEALALEEVAERHRFFVDWFTGRGPEMALEECARAFAPDFRRIGPDAREQAADEVVAMLRAARGRRGAGFVIRVVPRATRDLGGGLALVVYDELQEDGAERTARRASALFAADPSAPGGVVWRHLQETWIDPAPGAPPG